MSKPAPFPLSAHPSSRRAFLASAVRWTLLFALGPALPSWARGPAARDATLAPAPAKRLRSFRLEIREAVVPIADGVRMQVWTYGGLVPGPTLHVRQGDAVEVEVTNATTMGHSIDFHSAQLDWKTAYRTIAPGETLKLAFVARHAGAYLYHCGTPPIALHIGTGMAGAMIVDPVPPLPPAREFVLVYGGFTVTKAARGLWASDDARILRGEDDYLTFNGRAFQYRDDPLVVRKGDRVRFYVVCAGPDIGCVFHVVGQLFETVYLDAPPGTTLHWVQTVEVPPGGGMIFDLVADTAGTFPFVSHRIGDSDKGAMGLLVVVP